MGSVSLVSSLRRFRVPCEVPNKIQRSCKGWLWLLIVDNGKTLIGAC